MPLEPKSKKYLLSCIRQAVDDLTKSRFGGATRLVVRLITVGDLYPDDVWTKTLNMMAFTIAGTGTAMESELKEMDKERKDEFVTSFSKFLASLYSAVEEEDAPKTDNLLKEFVTAFFKEWT
jgi:hypothetical protein